MIYAEVIIPGFSGSHSGVFTYGVEEKLKVGTLVMVPLRNKYCMGIVSEIHEKTPSYKVRSVGKIMNNYKLELWQVKVMHEIAQYYMCSVGAVAKLFIPQKILTGKYTPPKEVIIQKKEEIIEISVDTVVLKDAYSEKNISEKMQKIIDFLSTGEKQREDLKQECEITNAYIQKLEKVGIVEVYEKKWNFLDAVFPKRSILNKVKILLEDLGYGPMPYVYFRDVFGSSLKRVFDEAEKHGYIEKIEQEIIPSTKRLTSEYLKKLHPDQQKVFQHILEMTHDSKKPTLLHGVTGSGKTEVYLHLIYHYVNQGTQAILLVPEISLTPQVVRYFSRIFGDQLAILHSRLSVTEKCNYWHNIYNGRSKVVIGSRSALFAPIKNPGVIIIDEEHEWTYKQESTPRYHARKVSEIIEKHTNARVMFGSATPSIETFYKAKRGDYHYQNLSQKAKHIANKKDDAYLNVETVDLRDEFHRKNMSMLSLKLQNKIQDRLEKREQVILFLNKRGSHSSVVCRECGYVESCPTCDVKLTHHTLARSAVGKLLCHHCGFIGLPPSKCPECDSPNIRYIGVGTQKVEAEVRKLFPQARVARADADTTSKKHDFEKLFEDFHDRQIDILVGTQMIAKGFDFPYVTLVGVILGETTLYIPDFRSTERMFQLLTQVSGRAGRDHLDGEVLIQTYTPGHFVFKHVCNHDYEGFYTEEVECRKDLDYPPFSPVVKLSISHADKTMCVKMVNDAKHILERSIKKSSSDIALYTAPALIPRMHGKYHFNIVLKGNNVREILESVELHSEWRVDIDPMQLC